MTWNCGIDNNADKCERVRAAAVIDVSMFNLRLRPASMDRTGERSESPQILCGQRQAVIPMSFSASQIVITEAYHIRVRGGTGRICQDLIFRDNADVRVVVFEPLVRVLREIAGIEKVMTPRW